MSKLTRRRMGLAAGGLGVLALAGVGDGLRRAMGASAQASARVYEAWCREQSCEPQDYLAAQGLSLSDADGIKRRIVADFEAGDLFVYEGLIASRCEIAVVACLGRLARA